MNFRFSSEAGFLLTIALGLAITTRHMWFKSIFYYPIINDISTDIENPPMFKNANIGSLDKNFKSIIKKYYPNIVSLVFENLQKQIVFNKALQLAQNNNSWTLTHVKEDDGIIEGYAKTPLLKFKDDFVIRISELSGSGVVVDMRSKSRLGKGDMGANAKRIELYFDNLKESLDNV